MTFPTRDQINPYKCLDGNVAEEHWYGLDMTQGSALIERNPIYYQEDFSHMGMTAFVYYIESVLIYLRTDKSDEDEDFVCGFLNTLELKMNDISPDYVGKFIPILEYINQHFHKFYRSNSPNSSIYLEKLLKISSALNKMK